MAEKLLIEEFAQTAVLVDNNPAEVQGLMEQLEASGILCKLYTPGELEKAPSKVLPHIVFLDLILDTSRSEIDNIAKIRSILRGKLIADTAEPYGVVLWTKHPDKLDLFREKISLDRKEKAYNTPTFIVGLNKNKYLETGYVDCLPDLEKILTNDKAASFFIRWMISVRKAAGTALSGIYSLVGDYEKQDTELLYLLSVLAQNHTGAPASKLEQVQGYNLTLDAYKAFDELIYADLINVLQSDGENLFGSPLPTNPWKNDFQHELNVYAQLNAKAFIDEKHIEQALVIPGNVYEIPRDVIPKTCGVPKEARTIMIELTPPCDYSNKKNVLSRCVCGFMWDCNVEQDHLAERLGNLEAGYRYLLWPIHFDKRNYILCFDFRCLISCLEEDITRGEKYKVLFKSNPRLFADVLQKFSSHAARLGISDIKPQMPDKCSMCKARRHSVSDDSHQGEATENLSSLPS